MALLTCPSNGFNHLKLEVNPAQGMVFCINTHTAAGFADQMPFPVAQKTALP